MQQYEKISLKTFVEGLSGHSKTREHKYTSMERSGERWSQYKSVNQQMAYKSNGIVKELSEHRENKKSKV